MRITTCLIRHRDAAAEAWLDEQGHIQATAPWAQAARIQRARRRLTLWDTLLDAWTRHGRRR